MQTSYNTTPENLVPIPYTSYLYNRKHMSHKH